GARRRPDSGVLRPVAGGGLPPVGRPGQGPLPLVPAGRLLALPGQPARPGGGPQARRRPPAGLDRRAGRRGPLPRRAGARPDRRATLRAPLGPDAARRRPGPARRRVPPGGQGALYDRLRLILVGAQEAVSYAQVGYNPTKVRKVPRDIAETALAQQFGRFFVISDDIRLMPMHGRDTRASGTQSEVIKV